MRKAFALLIVLFSVGVSAQNVGIGTLTPADRLEVKNALRSTIRISSNGFNDTTEIILRNRNSTNQGTDFSIKSIREEGLFVSSLSDLAQNTSLQSLVIKPNGQVGIGTVPTAKLDINGDIKLQGLNLFEFGAGIVGKEVNAGKIGYNAFGHNALTFVGAGTDVTNRAVYFFAEGGTTFNGPATVSGNTNIGGQLQINGDPGTAGQVLTSNGANDPTWKSTAYGNTTRFGLSFTHNITTGHSLAPLTTQYNLSPADVTIGANSFTINKTGLYHFDIILNSSLSISGTYGAFNFYLSPGGIDFLQDEDVFPRSSGIGKLNRTFSFSRHITAGSVFSFGSYIVLGSSGTNTGWVYCHLISE